MNVAIKDESVTTETWWFAWLIPLSETELANTFILNWAG